MALDLINTLHELQEQTKTQKNITGTEKTVFSSKRKFIDTLLQSYFGNQQFFDLFLPLRTARIGGNDRTVIPGYVSIEEYQALCFKGDDQKRPSYLILRLAEKETAHLYIHEYIHECLDENEQLDLKSASLKAASDFYKVGADYLTPKVTSAMDNLERKRFPRFCSSLGAVVKKALGRYESNFKEVQAEKTKIKEALELLEKGLERIS